LAVSDYENYFRWIAPIAAAVRPVASPAVPQSSPPAERQPTVALPGKRLDAVTSATPLTATEQPAASQPRDIAFAPSTTTFHKPAPVVVAEPLSNNPVAATPIRSDEKATTEIVAGPQSETTAPAVEKKASSDVASLTKSRSLVVAAPIEETNKPAEPTVASNTPEPVEAETRVAERSPAPVENTPAPAPEVAQTPVVAPAPTVGEAAEMERVPVVAQVQKPVAKLADEPMPAPANPKTLDVPEYPASTTIAEGVHPPLTTSSFLPANPESYCFRCGVQCPNGCNPGGAGWWASRPIPWEVYAQGEYIGPARLAHVPVYRLRVDDRISFVFRLSGAVAGQPYKLNVRDHILIQSLSAPEVVNRELIIQPDGTVTLPLLGQIRVAGSSIEDVTKQLDELYKKQMKDPRISVTPLVLNSNLDELRMSVDRRYGTGGLGTDARVSPDGTVQLPAIGAVPAQGLTLEELEREVKTRYAMIVEGLEVTPILLDRAPRFLYVVGEVRVPGRFEMTGPTTVMQAIALAGSWNVGAQLDHVVIFRRDENWRLMATKVNVKSSLLFKKPCPGGEIWLRDSDIVLVPKSPILCADDVINLVFTRGIYGVFPMTANLNFAKLSTL
jgi:polysaccharide export outer membrane protein